MAEPHPIQESQLKRFATAAYSEDVPIRMIRQMASELLSLRQQMGQRQAELEFNMQKNMQAPAVEPAQRCNCCGYLVTDSEHRGCLRAATQEPAQAVPQHVIEASNRIPQNIIETPQAVPVGYISEEDVYYFEQCGTVKISKRADTIKTVPVFADVPPAIDDETKRMVLELCRLIIDKAGPDSMITRAMAQKAEKISERLEAGQ